MMHELTEKNVRKIILGNPAEALYWYEIENFFNPNHHHAPELNGSHLETLTKLATKGRAPKNFTWKANVPIDVEKLLQVAQRQKIRAERLPILEDIIDELSERQGERAEERRERLESVRNLVSSTLRVSPVIRRQRDDIQGLSYRGKSHSNETVILSSLLRTSHIFPDFVDFIEQEGYAGVESFREIPQKIADVSNNPENMYKFSNVLQAHLALNGAEAIPLVLRYLPTIGSLSHSITKTGASQLLRGRRNRELIGNYPIRQARQALQFVAGGNPYGNRSSLLTAKTRPFYWDLMADKEWKWHGLLGYVTSHVRHRGDAERVLAAQVPDIIEQLDIAERIDKVPHEFVLARMLETSDLKPRPGEGDPFRILEIPTRISEYEEGVAVIKKHFPDIDIPPFSRFVGNRGFSYNLRSIKWFAPNYNPKDFGEKFNHPLLIELATRAGSDLLVGEEGNLRNLALAVDTLEALRPALENEHFEGLVQYVADQHGEEPKDIERFLDIYRRKGPWKKFGPDTEANKQKRQHIKSVKWKDQMSNRRLDYLLAENEQSEEVLKALTDNFSWQGVCDQLPYGDVFLDGFFHTRKETYRLYREFALQIDLSKFVFELVKELGPDHKRATTTHGIGINSNNRESVVDMDEERVYRAYQFYRLLERRLGVDKTTERQIRTETRTVKRLLAELEDFEKFLPEQEDNDEELYFSDRPREVNPMWCARYEKMHQIVSRQVNRALRRTREEAYPLGLEKILGSDTVVEEITPAIKTAIGVYFVTQNKPQLNGHLVRLLREHVDGDEHAVLSAEPNLQYVADMRAKGVNMDPWVCGHKEKHKVRSMSDSDIIRRKRTHIDEIKHILKRNSIPFISLESAVAQARKEIQYPDVLADLQVQVKAVEDLDRVKTSEASEEIQIYIETNPMNVIQMGDLVKNSCLRIGGGNTYSVISNAIDINKRVLYAAVNGRIVGRKLIGLSEDDKIVQFHTYESSELQLDRAFEDFIANLGKIMGVKLAHSGKIPALVADEWYDDGVRYFEHVKAANV